MPKQNGHRISTLEFIVGRLGAEPGANPHTAKFADLGKQMLTSVKALRDMDLNPNPAESEHSHATRCATAAKKLKARMADYEDEISNDVTNRQHDLDEKIRKKVMLKPDPQHEAETRAVFRMLPHDKKMEMLDQCAKDNDGPTIAAICCCPNFLSGVTLDIQATFKAKILTLHASQELAEKAVLNEAQQSIFAATDAAKSYANDFGDPAESNPQKEAQVTRDRAAALDATAAFDAATS